MCFPTDHSAQNQAAKTNAQVQAQNLQTQANIKQGQANIDNAFKGFNDNYYQGFENDYNNFYDPQITKQYKDTNATLAAGLVDQGMGASTVGNKKLADLSQQYQTTLVNSANSGVDAANALKKSVSDEESNLSSLNLASDDPNAINTQALASATSLAAPQSFTPLGQVFANALTPLSSYYTAAAKVPGAPYVSPYAAVGPASSAGSGSVVG